MAITWGAETDPSLKNDSGKEDEKRRLMEAARAAGLKPKQSGESQPNSQHSISQEERRTLEKFLIEVKKRFGRISATVILAFLGTLGYVGYRAIEGNTHSRENAFGNDLPAPTRTDTPDKTQTVDAYINTLIAEAQQNGDITEVVMEPSESAGTDANATFIPTAINSPTVVPSETQTPTFVPPTETTAPSATTVSTEIPIPTNTNTPPASETPQSTNTPEPSDTIAPTPTATNSETPTYTASPTNIYTASETSTPTQTPSRTKTPSRTPRPTHTETASRTPTETQTVTPTPTDTLTPTFTITPSETPTEQPSWVLPSTNTPRAKTTDEATLTPTGEGRAWDSFGMSQEAYQAAQNEYDSNVIKIATDELAAIKKDPTWVYNPDVVGYTKADAKTKKMLIWRAGSGLIPDKNGSYTAAGLKEGTSYVETDTFQGKDYTIVLEASLLYPLNKGFSFPKLLKQNPEDLENAITGMFPNLRTLGVKKIIVTNLPYTSNQEPADMYSGPNGFYYFGDGVAYVKAEQLTSDTWNILVADAKNVYIKGESQKNIRESSANEGFLLGLAVMNGNPPQPGDDYLRWGKNITRPYMLPLFEKYKSETLAEIPK